MRRSRGRSRGRSRRGRSRFCRGRFRFRFRCQSNRNTWLFEHLPQLFQNSSPSESTTPRSLASLVGTFSRQHGPPPTLPPSPRLLRLGIYHSPHGHVFEFAPFLGVLFQRSLVLHPGLLHDSPGGLIVLHVVSVHPPQFE